MAAVESESKTPFVTVRYGDNKELMINTDCMVCNMIDFIKSRTEHYDLELDLATEQGELRGISMEDRYFKQASSFLPDREQLILIRVERMGEQMKNKARYLPLLHDSQVINASFLTNLAKHGPDSRKNYRMGKYQLPGANSKDESRSQMGGGSASSRHVSGGTDQTDSKSRRTPKSRERPNQK